MSEHDHAATPASGVGGAANSTHSFGGYTCPSCGVWVQQGFGHVCSPNWNHGTYPTYTPPTPIYYNTTVDLTPLIEMIKELAEKVDKLTELLASKEDN